MTTGKVLDGKPYAENPHTRLDEETVAPTATQRRGTRLYKAKAAIVLLALGVNLTCFARIVHTPAEAIASGTNPATVNGATWSFHRRLWWNCPNLATGDRLVFSTWSSGLVGFCIDGREPWLPCILANNTDHMINERYLMGADNPNFIDIDLVAPGEVVMHPEKYSATAANRAVLRFTVPRTGRYSLSAVFRALNGIPFGNSQKIDVSILLDNTLLFIDELTHPDNAARKTFSFDSMYLQAGQTIDFVVGMGLTETEANSHQGDTVGLTLTIMEEDETADPLDGAWDLGTAFFAEYQKDAPSVPFPADNQGSGATWGFYSVQHSPFFFEYASPTSINVWAENGNFRGPRVTQIAETDRYAHLGVYDPATNSSVLAGLGTSGANWIDRIAPGEVVIHPYPGNTDIFLRFTVPADGRYVASYALRDAAKSNNPSDTRNGVDVYVQAGSVFLDERHVSSEHGSPIVFRQVVTPPLKAGTAVDVHLYHCGQYSFDGTVGKVQMFKLKDSVPTSGFCAATALRANVNGANTNPFTDEKGATWTLGVSLSPTCEEFYTMRNQSSSSKFKLWLSRDFSIPWDPRFAINTTLDCLAGPVDNTVVSGHYLFPNEVFLHPSSVKTSNANVFAVLRFAAPQAGIYSIDAVVRDLNRSSKCAAGTGGVLLHVMGPGGAYLASGYACCDANNTFVWSHLHPGHVYLQAGETIDVCVAPKTARQTDCDATSLYENIHVADMPEQTFLGIDIRTAVGVSSRYTARGRVGFGEQVWSTTRTDNGTVICENMKSSGGISKTVFSLSRSDGIPVAATLGVNTLLDDGVVSSGTNDVYTFTFTQLVPNSEYKLYLYGCTVADGGVPTFEVGEVSATPELGWSRPFTNDVAVLTVVSDATGTITGTFHSSGDASAAFCGVQIAGSEFYYQRGLSISIR